MTTVQRIGKYEIAEQIGVGGFGVVYKAWDPYIQRWVALKTCAATDEEATQRFFREAQLAGAPDGFSTILHPQFVKDAQVVSFDRTQGQDKPLADFVIGESLGDQAQHFQLAFAQRLDHAHGCGWR